MGLALGRSLRASVAGFVTFEALRDLHTTMFALATELRASFAARAADTPGVVVAPVFFPAASTKGGVSSTSGVGRLEATPSAPDSYVPDSTAIATSVTGIEPWLFAAHGALQVVPPNSVAGFLASTDYLSAYSAAIGTMLLGGGSWDPSLGINAVISSSKSVSAAAEEWTPPTDWAPPQNEAEHAPTGP